ncbi:MAG: NADH-quinone oxidoreductase subunit L [Planctomycetota bacterium]
MTNILTTFHENPEVWLALIPVLPLMGFLFNAAFGKGLTLKASGGIATAAVFGSFVIALFLFTGPLQTGKPIHSIGYSWIATAGLSVDFRLYLDNLSGIYMLVITGIGSLIHLYSIGYMSHDKAYARFFTYLNLFIFSMLMLILGNSLLTLFLGWEGVGLCSYLLIGFWYTDVNNSKAGMKAFIANRVGDFGFLIGMMLIFWHFKTLEYTSLADKVHIAELAGTVDTTLLNWACIFLFIGATGKSAQIPLFVWLPDAMAGPTPVSALIHAATMVTAGIYMCSRMNFIFVHAETALMIVAIVGGLTAVFSGTVALAQRDIKKTLAYSTVSQLGFMFMAVGLGAFDIAVFHVVTHAFFKALLFLGSGSVIHSLEHTLGHGHPDSQDMTKMGGLKSKMPITFLTMSVGAVALAGIPLFSGFFSKDQILFAAFHRGDTFGYIIYGLGLVGAFCTALYSARLIGLTFFGKWRGDEKVYAHADESPRSMTIPLCVLALGSFLVGYTWLPGFTHIAPFQNWLKPVFAQGQAVLTASGSHFAIAYDHSGALNAELISMGLSIVIAVGVAVVAFRIYKTNAGLEKMDKMVHTEDGQMKPAYKLLSNKYYVDEIYHAGIVKPLLMASDVLWLVVDIFVIEMVCVQGFGSLAKTTSRIGRRLQTGVVRHYLYAFGVGAVFFMILFLVISAKAS